MELSAKSQALLKKVHPDLVRVVLRAARMRNGDPGFIVTCGIRTLEEQKRLKKVGATTTLRSRHLPGRTNGLSHAVDIAPTLRGKVKWDWPLFHVLAATFKAAAEAEEVPLEWGGDWRTFKDGPHFQLPWKKYPG